MAPKINPPSNDHNSQGRSQRQLIISIGLENEIIQWNIAVLHCVTPHLMKSRFRYRVSPPEQ